MRALLFVSLASCASPSPVPSPDGPDTKHRIGDACRSDGDCIEGAACMMYTCDFVGPENGRVSARHIMTWSADGRVMTEAIVEGDDTVFTRSETRDARGVVGRSDERGTQTITRSESWKCRAGTVVMHDPDGALLYTSRPTCNGDGVPETIDHVGPDGEVVEHTVYAIDDGRIVAQLTRETDGRASRQTFRRDGRGVVVARQYDSTLDGTDDIEESNDLSCWLVDGDRVRYRPTSRTK